MQQVLSIGETVEEVSDSGFLASAPTLRTQLLADDSMLQVQLPIGSCDALAVVAMSRSFNPIPARHGISGIATTCLSVGTPAVAANQGVCRDRGACMSLC